MRHGSARWQLLILMLSFHWRVMAALPDAQDEFKLLPPHDELTPTYWQQHGTQIILATIGILLFLAAGIVWARRPKTIVFELPVIIACRALESLRNQKEDGALAMNASRVLRRYLTAVLELPDEELTTSEWRETLKTQSRIEPTLASALNDFFHRCDERKFAPVSSATPANSVNEALALVNDVEARLAVSPNVATETNPQAAVT